MPETPPPDAITLPQSQVFPTFLPLYLHYLQVTTDHENAPIMAHYYGQVEQWVIRNTHNRDVGIAPDAKPVAEKLWKLHVIENPDASATFWQAQDGDPAGPPCPDLAPLPPQDTGAIPPGTPIFGKKLPGVSNWWACMPADTVAMNASVTIVPGQTLGWDSVTPPVGTYVKIPSIGSMAWYQQQPAASPNALISQQVP